jgi:PKD repeat protein
MTARKKATGGRFRTALGGVAGLISGALLAYFTPFVDRVVKPAVPLANFDTRRDGLTVTFQNLSQGPRLTEGWWDFGDGSPLQPVVPDQPLVSHTYARPGDYTARLTLRNALGETNERSVTLQLEASTPAEPPKVQALDAAPLTPEPYAPATFRVSSEVKGAQFCVWDLDEGRPLEVVPESTGHLDRLVTFQRAGGYVIKLAAFNGSQIDQKSVIVNVLPPPNGFVTAALSVTDRATRVVRIPREYNFAASFSPDQAADGTRFTRFIQATPGFSIADLQVRYPSGPGPGLQGGSLVPIDAAALGLSQTRNLILERTTDGQSVRLSGELVRPAGQPVPPAVVVPVVLVEERRGPARRPTVPVMVSLSVPGSAQIMLPPVPAHWVDVRREVRFELRDGSRVLWSGPSLPRAAVLTLNNRRCELNAVQTSDRIQVNLGALGPAATVGSR